MGHADPQHRGQRGQFIQPRVLKIPGHKTKQTAQHKTDQGGQQGQAQGVAHRLHHLAEHRPVAGDRSAQITLHRTPHPRHKLFRVRAVEAVELFHFGLQLSRSVGWQDGHQGVARCQVHQGKTHQSHTQHDGQGVDQASPQKAKHPIAPEETKPRAASPWPSKKPTGMGTQCPCRQPMGAFS